MAVSPGLVLIVEQSLSRALALRNRLDTLRRRYSDRLDLAGTQILLRALYLACSEVERLLVGQARRLQDDESPATQRVVQQTVTAAIRALELTAMRPLETLSHTHGREFDPYIEPLTRLARQVGARDAELIFQPSEGPVYATIPLDEPLEELGAAISPELGDTLRALPHLRIVYYPVNAEPETFMHLLIGHELGHIVLRQEHPGGGGEIGRFYFAQAIDRHRTSLSDEVIRRVRQRTPSGNPLSREDLVDEYSSARRRSLNWFEELACDLMALHMVGPAFFFALVTFASPLTGFGGGTKTHPPLALRLHRLVRLVRTRIPKAWNDLPEKWVDGDGQERVEPRAACARLFDHSISMIPAAPRSVEARIAVAAVNELSRDVASILGDAQYTPRKFRGDLDLVWQNLDDRIAPVERIVGRSAPRGPKPNEGAGEWSSPLDWRSIVNVGMFYWLNETPQQELPLYRRSALEQDEARLRFARHIRGAVELSEILRSAEKLRSGLLELDGHR